MVIETKHKNSPAGFITRNDNNKQQKIRDLQVYIGIKLKVSILFAQVSRLFA